MASASQKGGVGPGAPGADQQLPAASSSYPHHQQPQQHQSPIVYPHPATQTQSGSTPQPQQPSQPAPHYQSGCPSHQPHHPAEPTPNIQLDQVTIVPFHASPSELNKSTTLAVILCVPILGILGLHHFYLNRPFMGFIYAFTLGLCCLGWITDWFRIRSLVRNCNFETREAQIRGYQLYSSKYPVPVTKKVSLCDAYLLWLPPIGLLGFYHYYLGRNRMGIYHTLTFGRCGLGWLFDFCRLPAMVRKANSEFAMMRKGVRIDDDPPYSICDAYSLCFPLGFFGLHHFYLGNTKRGFLFLFTLGVFGLGWLADMFQMPMIVSEANKNKDLKKRLNTVMAQHGTCGSDHTTVVVVQSNLGYQGGPGDVHGVMQGGAMSGGAMPGGAVGGVGVVHEPPPVYKAQAGEGESVVAVANGGGDGVSGQTSHGYEAEPNPPVDKKGFVA